MRSLLLLALAMFSCGTTVEDPGAPPCPTRIFAVSDSDYTRVTCTITFPSEGETTTLSIDDLSCAVSGIDMPQ